MGKAFTTDFVRQVFLDRGATPTFGEYRNAAQDLTFLCSCGNPGSVFFSNLFYKFGKDGSPTIPLCAECVAKQRKTYGKSEQAQRDLEKGRAQRAWTLDRAKKLILDHGAQPKFGTFPGIDADLLIACSSCSGGMTISVRSLCEAVRGAPEHRIRCRGCVTTEVYKKKRVAGADQLDFEVKAYLAEYGAVPLFDKFTGTRVDAVRFRCPCPAGNEHEISWGSMVNLGTVPRCVPCRDAARPRGESHPNWDPNLTDEQRARWDGNGSDWPLQKWYSDVKVAASFTCCLTGQIGGDLESHHVAWSSRHPDKMLDLSNGRCVLKTLHLLFHKLYGKGMKGCKTVDEVVAWNEFCSRFHSGEFKGRYEHGMRPEYREVA